MDKISVEPFNTEAKQQSEQMEEKTRRVMQPHTGDLVYARVMKIEDRFAKVDILAIDDDPISAVFIGFI